MKKDYTDITIVLDRSGSMATVQGDTIGGFETFIKGQREASGEATVTLAQFDDIYEVIYEGRAVKEVPKFEFVPRGMTALLDAIGKTVNRTGERIRRMKESDRPEKVVFMIITDGAENSSKEFTKEKINEMIKHQKEKYNWEFVFMGADQDAIAAGASIGVSSTHSYSYYNTSAGIHNMWLTASSNTAMYRSGVTNTMAFSDEDKRTATETK